MWAPDTFMEQLYSQYETVRAKERNKQDRPDDWLRVRLREALLEPLPFSRDEWKPVLLESVEYDDYVRERVELGTISGLRVPVYVLVPKGHPGKRPCVLALHGHGYGSRELAGLHADGTDRHETGYHGDYARELAKRGMLVIAPEVIGFGDRRLEADQQTGKTGNSSCQTLASHLLLYGMSLAGVRVYEALLLLDYLIKREDADPQRIGCIGFSGGGLVAAYAAALDERIRATVLCSFPNTFKSSIMAVPHCIDNYVPGLLRYGELPDYLGLIAPRGLFIESGEMDRIFPVAGVRETIAQLETVFEKSNAGYRLGYDLHEGAHEVNGRNAFPWLIEQLTAN